MSSGYILIAAIGGINSIEMNLEEIGKYYNIQLTNVCSYTKINLW